MLKAVLFDMDGVLLDSEPLHLEAVNRLLEEIQCFPTKKRHHNKIHGADYKTIWNNLRQIYNIKYNDRELLDMQIECTCKYFNEIRLIETKGLKEFIKELNKNGILCGVCSSSPQKIVKQVLKQLNINVFISKYSCEESVDKLKPAPDVYLLTASLLGVKPSECVVFEDSIIGVTSAKNAGMKCVVINSIYMTKELKKMSDLIIDDFSNINYAQVVELVK